MAAQELKPSYVSNKPGQASAWISACQLFSSLVSLTVTSAAPALTADEAHDPWSSNAHNAEVTCLIKAIGQNRPSTSQKIISLHSRHEKNLTNAVPLPGRAGSREMDASLAAG